VAVFAASLALEIFSAQKGQSFYNSLNVEFVPRSTQNTSGDETPADSVGIPADDNIPSDSIRTHVPIIDFDSARETLPDIAAWIQSYGTPINYPVVHGADNSFYLSHLPDKSSNKMGSIFLDYRNMADFSDKNIAIYGHDTKSGDMFGSLKNYTDQSYFEQHDVIFLFTPAADYELILFAGYILNSAYEVPPMSFSDSEDFGRYISDISRRSLFKSDAEVSFGDKLVFLCTCTPNGSKDDRFVLVCKLTMK
jgi:sortase B